MSEAGPRRYNPEIAGFATVMGTFSLQVEGALAVYEGRGLLTTTIPGTGGPPRTWNAKTTAGPKDDGVATHFLKFAIDFDAKLRREVMDRAVYIHAWAGLEYLLKTCLEAILESNPTLLIPDRKAVKGQSAAQWVDVIEHVVKDDWVRDQVVKELVARRTRALDFERLDGLPRVFRRLRVRWDDSWNTDLAPIRDARNDAAHKPGFRVESAARIKEHIDVLGRVGRAIGDACRARYPRAFDRWAPTAATLEDEDTPSGR